MSIKIENTQVFGWEGAIRGARNPMNSWEKSDSAFFGGFDFTSDYYFRDINGKRRDWQDWLPPSEKEPSKRDVIKWSKWQKKRKMWEEEPFPKPYHDNENGGCRIGDVLIGPNDHKLLMNLCKGGTEEAKWRRMIHVQMDVTAPLYWWKEFETYKIGTVSNSCSTMHKIQAKEFIPDDFSCEHLFKWPNVEEIPNFENDEDLKAYKEQTNKALEAMREGKEHKWPERVDSAAEREVKWHFENGAYEAGVNYDPYATSEDLDEWAEAKYAFDVLEVTIGALNYYREKFIETKDKKYWWQMIQLLPSSYNQKRTIDLNYEVLAAQYRQRKDHKLTEWHQYCDWIHGLPYSEFITMEDDNDVKIPTLTIEDIKLLHPKYEDFRKSVMDGIIPVNKEVSDWMNIMDRILEEADRILEETK